jgi:hypothetical protein
MPGPAPWRMTGVVFLDDDAEPAFRVARAARRVLEAAPPDIVAEMDSGTPPRWTSGTLGGGAGGFAPGAGGSAGGGGGGAGGNASSGP